MIFIQIDGSHRKYCISFYRMKSGKIHWNTWRGSSQILEGHSICPVDLHQLVEQCLIHYDDNTNVWLVFWPYAFTSTQLCSIIQTMCRCKYDKANTNTCHAMWLVRVVFFLKSVQSPLLSSSPCRLKKAMFCTKVLATDPFSSTFMNGWLWCYYWYPRGFYLKSLQPEKNPSCIACGTCIKDITCMKAEV